MFNILKSEKDIITTLRKNLPNSSYKNLVFFSSPLNSFITDPIFMSINMEDKIVHRSYAAFEVTKIFKNKIYNLDKHIDRFYKSLETLNLKNHLYSKDEIRLILQRLAAIARKIEPTSDIDMRFYYSAGLGNFTLKVDNNLNTFYAIATKVDNSVRPIEGINETLYNINEIRDKVATAKTTNYLCSSIIACKAHEDGGYLGLISDKDGNILEGVVSNIAFVLNDDTYSVPSFEKTLPGTTAIKCLEFCEKNLIPNNEISKISREDVNIKDIMNGKVKEVMMVGGDFVVPILKINGFEISKNPGKITRLCQDYMKSQRAEAEDELKEYDSIPNFTT